MAATTIRQHHHPRPTPKSPCTSSPCPNRCRSPSSQSNSLAPHSGSSLPASFSTLAPHLGRCPNTLLASMQLKSEQIGHAEPKRPRLYDTASDTRPFLWFGLASRSVPARSISPSPQLGYYTSQPLPYNHSPHRQSKRLGPSPAVAATVRSLAAQAHRLASPAPCPRRSLLAHPVHRPRICSPIPRIGLESVRQPRASAPHPLARPAPAPPLLACPALWTRICSPTLRICRRLSSQARRSGAASAPRLRINGPTSDPCPPFPALLPTSRRSTPASALLAPHLGHYPLAKALGPSSRPTTKAPQSLPLPTSLGS